MTVVLRLGYLSSDLIMLIRSTMNDGAFRKFILNVSIAAKLNSVNLSCLTLPFEELFEIACDSLPALNLQFANNPDFYLFFANAFKSLMHFMLVWRNEQQSNCVKLQLTAQ